MNIEAIKKAVDLLWDLDQDQFSMDAGGDMLNGVFGDAAI